MASVDVTLNLDHFKLDDMHVGDLALTAIDVQLGGLFGPRDASSREIHHMFGFAHWLIVAPLSFVSSELLGGRSGPQRARQLQNIPSGCRCGHCDAHWWYSTSIPHTGGRF